MTTDKFIVTRSTAEKLIQEFFDSERSCITLKKYEETDAEGKGFLALEVILRGRK